MSKYENNPKEFLSKLSNEEFRQLLEEAGFEVEDGEGKVILTETEIDFEWNEIGAPFKINTSSSFKVEVSKEMNYPFKRNTA